MQNIELLKNRGLISEEPTCFLNSHIENVRNVFLFEVDFQRFMVVTRSTTLQTLDIHIGQKLHLNPTHAVSSTDLTTPPTFHVETKFPCIKLTHLRFRDIREQITDRCEDTCIGRGVGSRRPSDR